MSLTRLLSSDKGPLITKFTHQVIERQPFLISLHAKSTVSIDVNTTFLTELLNANDTWRVFSAVSQQSRLCTNEATKTGMTGAYVHVMQRAPRDFPQRLQLRLGFITRFRFYVTHKMPLRNCHVMFSRQFKWIYSASVVNLMAYYVFRACLPELLFIF